MLDLTPPPHAWVVEYRALDHCAPPDCALRSRDVFGWADELQPDGERGANVQFGRHGDDGFYEMFFHRGKILAPGESFAFDLGESGAPSELDVHLSAEEENHGYRARLTFEELPPAGAARRIFAEDIDGFSEEIGDPPTVADFAHEARAFTHVRRELPSRAHRSIRVRITNTGGTGLGVSSPLVMKRVEGRGPRQALFVIYDAVPYPLFDGLLRGPTRDPPTEWLPNWVHENGTYFPDGLSPGLQTSSFCWRFFRAGYYDMVGEPLIRRDLREAPPEHVPTLIAALAAQGVTTYAIGANFSLTSGFSYVGWDGGYDTEMPDHPAAIGMRYAEWLAEHPDDDAFVVAWFASTHDPWPDTRPVASSPPLPVDYPPEAAVQEILTPIWANALEATDRLRDMRAAAHAIEPRASRMTYLAADHGRSFSIRSTNRAFRSAMGDVAAKGLSHGAAASAEEMRTPFAIMYDGPPAPWSRPRIVTGDISTLAVLRAFREFFDVELSLPDTRAFDAPFFSGPEAYAARWDDGVYVGVGSAHTWRFVRGNFAYAEYEPRFEVTPIWGEPPAVQRMLAGTPFRSGRVLAEELYDRTRDPYEWDNVAGEHVPEVLELRRRATDWLATYWDGAGHPRHRYTLTFAQRVNGVVTAPRAFEAIVDGAPARMRTPRSVDVAGTRVEILEQADTVGVIEIAGDVAKAPLTLRCASNGLPVDVTTPERPRLNLALARTNCPVKKADHVIAMPDSVMFSFEARSSEPPKK